MIARAMQRSYHGSLDNAVGDTLKFNKHITAWTTPNVPSILYDPVSGYFTIPSATLNDYIITWSVSVHTSTVTDGFGETFQLLIKYEDGSVTEGCFSCCTTAIGIIKAFKTIHITRISRNDTLKFYIVNNGFFSQLSLATPRYPLPNGFTENDIFNANICIYSI